MSALRRLYACAFLADGAQYLLLSAMLWKALDLGASSLVLGILPACSLSVYILSAVLMGRRSDRLATGAGRLRQARHGVLLVAVAALLLRASPSLPFLPAAVMPVGLGLGFFWPAVMAVVAEWTPDARGPALARFNIAWSLGKASGYFASGFLVGLFGADATMWVAGVMAIVVFVLLPVRAAHSIPQLQTTAFEEERDPTRMPDALGTESAHDETRVHRFRRVGWLLNAAGFGFAATLGSQYPKWLAAQGLGEIRYGLVLATVTAAQGVAFVALGRHRGWQWRRAPVFLAVATAALAAFAISRLTSVPPLVITAAALGFGIGAAYHASLHYSVWSAASRGRYAGMHESALATSALLMPVAAGAIADWSGDLRAPYVFGGGIMVMALVLGSWILRPRARPG